MIRFTSGIADRFDPVLQDQEIALRPARRSDSDAWRALRVQSRTHLTRWEPDWRDSDMSDEAMRLRLRFQARERAQGKALPLLIFRRGDQVLLGGINLISIRYHASRSASLGYWIGAPFVRRGYARAAVHLVCAHAFETLTLNRIEAATRPDNTPSRTLLEKSGFSYEGLARDFLHINGAWRDHCIYARLARDWAQDGSTHGSAHGATHGSTR